MARDKVNSKKATTTGRRKAASPRSIAGEVHALKGLPVESAGGRGSALSPAMAELKKLLNTEEFSPARVVAAAITTDDPGNSQAWSMLSYIEMRLNDYPAAGLAAEKALALSPEQPVANFVRGVLAHEDCEYALAERCFRKMLAVMPDDPAGINNLANAILKAERPQEAAQILETALLADPDNIELLNTLGLAYSDLTRYEEARQVFQRILDIDPTISRALSNMAKQELELGNKDAALDLFTKAVELNPRDEYAQLNLGITYVLLGRIEDAMPCLRAAVEVNPRFGPAHYNLATTSLVIGDFRRGWEEWQWRYPRRSLERGKDNWVPVTPPLPDNLAGCWVSLQGEQGIGDELFFLRFVPMLKARGALVAYRPVWAKAESLIARLDFIDAKLTTRQEVEEGAVGPYWIGDLPYLLGASSLADVPPPYSLTPDPARVANFFLQWLEPLPPPYIGITWRAGTQNQERVGGIFLSLSKELPLESLVESLRGLKGTIVILQRNPKPEEIEYLSANLSMPLLDCSDLNDDLEDMLAALYLLDDVVGVSNTNVHLRAALGKGGRTLVPLPSEFRWMKDGDETPWFPGFKVYRENIKEGWVPAFEKLRSDMERAGGDPAV